MIAMCGIAGYVGRSLVDPEQRKKVLTDMMDMIVALMGRTKKSE